MQILKNSAMNALNCERWKDLFEFTITFQEIKKLRPQSNQFQGIESVKKMGNDLTSLTASFNCKLKTKRCSLKLQAKQSKALPKIKPAIST